VAIKKKDGGGLALGVQYWGITGSDPAGSRAALTVTVVPAWDNAKVKSVSNAIKQKDPQATFAVPNLISSKMGHNRQRALFAAKPEYNRAIFYD
jgi:hypothetical protein